MKKIIGLLLVIGVLFGLHYLVRGSYAYRHIRVDFEGYNLEQVNLKSKFKMQFNELQEIQIHNGQNKLMEDFLR